MSKEIKYRAWDKQKKQMVYGIEETYDGLPYSELNEKVDLDIYNHMSCFSSWLCGDYEVMQYTGLKDNNGVEIYEGDILYYTPFETHSNDRVVEYKLGFYHGKLIRNGYSQLLHECIEDVEVIGNIYSNPGLLEEEDE